MNNNLKTIPLIAAEIISDRLDRTIKRLWITVILLIVLLVGTNGMWLWYESQFESFSVTQESEDGNNNFIGNDGETLNGEADR